MASLVSSNQVVSWLATTPAILVTGEKGRDSSSEQRLKISTIRLMALAGYVESSIKTEDWCDPSKVVKRSATIHLEDPTIWFRTNEPEDEL